jgi:thiol-disulfide isomerase/thioredoxin
MSSRLRRSWKRCRSALAGLCLLGGLATSSEAQTISGAAPAGSAATTPVKVEPIALPNGSPAELLTFITTLQKERPTGTDYPAMIARVKAVQNAVIEASEKILSAPTATEAEITVAASGKIGALMMLRRMGEPDANDRAAKYLEELQKDPRPYLPPIAQIYVLATRLQNLDSGNQVEVEKFVADVRAHVKTGAPDGRNLSLAFQTARAAEQAGLDKLAVETYNEFAAWFAKSADPSVVANAKKLEGSARLLSLPGNEMELKGKLLDGKEFNWNSYRGKTVLVDFWATWCGPCIAELPTVKDCYAKYHERGFEVVGISLDSDKQRLDDFMKRDPLPWPVLFSDDPATNGWNHPLAQYYGIMAIPRAILVDKNGKVVSLQARGEDLWDLLAKEIGPPVVEKPKPKEGEAAPIEAKPAEKTSAQK